MVPALSGTPSTSTRARRSPCAPFRTLERSRGFIVLLAAHSHACERQSKDTGRCELDVLGAEAEASSSAPRSPAARRSAPALCSNSSPLTVTHSSHSSPAPALPSRAPLYREMGRSHHSLAAADSDRAQIIASPPPLRSNWSRRRAPCSRLAMTGVPRSTRRCTGSTADEAAGAGHKHRPRELRQVDLAVWGSRHCSNIPAC